MELTFNINKQSILRTDNEHPVAGSVNYLKARFYFLTEEWDNLTKTAIFSSNRKSYTVILEDDACTIPWEVLTGKLFTVSVFAGDLITVNTALVKLINSGYTSGETPQPPSSDVYNKIIKMVEDIGKSGVTISSKEGNIITSEDDGLYAPETDLTNYATKSSVDEKMDKVNPTGSGSVSIGRIEDEKVGTCSIAIGNVVEASGTSSFATGYKTIASGNEGSFASGYKTTASGASSHAEGSETKAIGGNSHAEGIYSTASGSDSHAEGYDTTASGRFSHSEGWQTNASGDYSHAEGGGNSSSPGSQAVGNYSHAEGFSCYSEKECSHSEGYNTSATGENSHAEGLKTIASGVSSHAEGVGTTASGECSHAEGDNTTASGDYSHAEGGRTTASGNYSHAESNSTTASGNYSHAEGTDTTASGKYSHAEGDNTTASGECSHAEGGTTIASGFYSHAGGCGSTAKGYYSQALGHGVVAGYESQFVCGSYNSNSADNVLEVGNGSWEILTQDPNRSNAMTVSKDGTVTATKFVGAFDGTSSKATSDADGNVISTTYLKGSEKGTSVATLVDGKVPESQLPSYVDDVLEYASKSGFPTTGETGKIYVALDTNLTYRWSGTTYVEISPSLALGETSSTAYAGDKGKAVTDALATHKADTVSHITAAERTSWNAKYDKPSTGISKTDLDSSVQTSLGKADTALQSYTEKYTGTITGITMNGASKGTSGVVDLGTVITSHQDISGKVDKVDGKGLSTNDYTTDEKNKLSGIAAGAEVNVQSDWNVTDTASDAFIKNKPTIPTVPTKVSAFTNDAGYLTGITSSQVTTALGYTPYNSTNPNGYTSNTGTVTSVAVKMNDTVKGTVTSNGTIDLGTVITSHQDISGKVDKTTTVNGHDLSSNVTVTASDVGLGNVGDFKAVSTVASQGLTDTEKSNARANIGAGTSSFSGSYTDLTNTPTIPSGAAASKDVDTSISAASTSTNLPTSQAVASFVEGKGYKTTDTNTTYTLTQDSSDGHKITLTPSTGSATTITIPDNNTTYSVATSSTAGLVKSATTGTTSERDYNVQVNTNGTMKVNVPWTDTNTTYSDMTGATSSAAGTHGLVPAPAAGKQTSFLRGDGTWVVPTDTITTATTTGSGNAVTAITASNGALTVTKGSSFSTTDHVHISLKANTDNRSTATKPNDYNGLFTISGLKRNSTLGISDGSEYSALVGLRGWSDSAGGNAHELAFTGNGKIMHRNGATTSWGDWSEIAHASDIPTKVSSLTNDSGYITSSGSCAYATKAGSAPASDVYAWAKASSKPSYSFSEIGSRGEALLGWGGRNFSGSFGPIDAGMVPELGANRLAFMSPSSVTIEYSRDGGSTWTDYSASDDTKLALFDGNGASLVIGRASSSSVATANYQLRVTIATGAANVYTALNKFCIYVTTNGSKSCWCTIRARLQSDYSSGTDTWTTFATKAELSGWSGYNIINTSYITTYGNSASTQFGQVQFIFGNDTVSGISTSYFGLVITKIFGFGGVGWNTPSTMAKYGRMYTYDQAKNVTFPAKVTATAFDGNASSASKLGSSTVGGTTTPIYLNAGTATACSYTLAKSVPSDAVFTDTDTKNTAGSTDTSSKIFLIGATSQAANPQTYSQDTAYVGTDGCLYSGGSKVLTSHQDISGKANLSGATFTGAISAPSGTFGPCSVGTLTATSSITLNGNGITDLPFIIEVTSGTLTAASGTEITVKYGRTLANTPKVMATLNSYTGSISNVLSVHSISSITTSQCVVKVFNPSSSAISLSSNRKLVCFICP